MKKVITLFATALVFMICTSFSGIRPEDANIKITGGKVFFQQKEISDLWKVTSFENVLGESNREDGSVKVYDNLGVCLFASGGDETVAEIQVHFGFSDSTSSNPRHTFKGKLLFDNVQITRDETPESLKKKMKDWDVVTCYLDHNVKMVNNGIYVFFEFNDEETRLNKVCFGHEDDPDEDVQIEEEQPKPTRDNEKSGGF